jgi:pimeloyl-ACP methyl ester carboxylesterase
MYGTAFSAAHISTNDRSLAPARALKGALSVLSRTAPSLAAEAASRLFVLVPRVPRPRGQSAAFLSSGEAFTVRVAGRRLAAWSMGHGPAILLVHGWGGRGAQMRAFVPALVGAGYRAVVFDGPAHGVSGGRSTNLPAFGDAVAAVAGATCARGVIAHSLGGLSTLLALSRGLSLSRAVLLGAPSNAERIWRDFARALGLSDTVAADAHRRLERRIGVTFGDLNVSSYASRIATPVLVFHDRDDGEVPWGAGEENARLLPGGRLVTTHGLGHRGILRNGGVVEQAVRFLEEGIAPERCAVCRSALGRAGTGTLCGNCALGRDLFERDGRFAA